MIFKGRPVQVVMEEQASAVETHGVNLPGPWLSAFQWDNRWANLQARCARNLFQISCVLGVPKSVALSGQDSFLPGGCHVLHLPDGRRVEHALCAHLHGSLWYCHPGSVRGDEISLTEPFATDDLVLLDVRRRRWQRRQSCRSKRLRGRVQQRNLLRVIQRQKEKFDWIVAVAHWRAEERRASENASGIDFERAARQWELDLLKWPRGARQQMVFWTWREGCETDIVHAAVPMRTEYFSNWLIRGVPPQLI